MGKHTSKRTNPPVATPVKLAAIKRVRKGESKASVARSLGVPESTLRGWCKTELKIKLQQEKELAAALQQQQAAEKEALEAQKRIGVPGPSLPIPDPSCEPGSSRLIPAVELYPPVQQEPLNLSPTRNDTPSPPNNSQDQLFNLNRVEPKPSSKDQLALMSQEFGLNQPETFPNGWGSARAPRKSNSSRRNGSTRYVPYEVPQPSTSRSMPILPSVQNNLLMMQDPSMKYIMDLYLKAMVNSSNLGNNQVLNAALNNLQQHQRQQYLNQYLMAHYVANTVPNTVTPHQDNILYQQLTRNQYQNEEQPQATTSATQNLQLKLEQPEESSSDGVELNSEEGEARTSGSSDSQPSSVEPEAKSSKSESSSPPLSSIKIEQDEQIPAEYQPPQINGTHTEDEATTYDSNEENHLGGQSPSAKDETRPVHEKTPLNNTASNDNRMDQEAKVSKRKTAQTFENILNTDGANMDPAARNAFESGIGVLKYLESNGSNTRITQTEIRQLMIILEKVAGIHSNCQGRGKGKRKTLQDCELLNNF